MSDWRAAARKLLAGYGKVREFSTRDFGREPFPDCVSVVIPGGGSMVQDAAVSALAKVRKALPPGTVAWLGTTRWLGKEKNEDKVELAIGPGKDQFDILRNAQSDACNYDMMTEDLVAKLTRYDKAYGIDILHAETDTIEFDVTGEVADWDAFAQDLYKFCPDIVDQGIGSVEGLREALIDTGRVYLWWD